MSNEQYISANKITSKYDITSGTIRRWAEEGKIQFIRPNGTKRLYNVPPSAGGAGCCQTIWDFDSR